MKRKFLVGLTAAFTALCMMFGIAACGETQSDFTFEQSGDGFSVTAYHGTETSIVVPAEHDGKPVTAIASGAFYAGAFTSITIPASVTSIGKEAFLGCKGLQSVSFENNSNLTSIGSDAFKSCSSLQEVHIPEGVTSIGGAAFGYCSRLQSISLPKSVALIGDSVFANCSSLQSITLPDSVTWIGGSAFENCSSLQSVTFGNNSKLTSIGEEAFSGCSGLQEVHISDLSAWCGIRFDKGSSNPLSYAHHLYLKDVEVENLTIPEDVTSIGEYAFWGCSGLQSITFGDNSNLTWIRSGAFYECSGLTSITIPNSVREIGISAFYGCSSLQSVTFESNSKLTAIESRVFYECSGLQSVTIPDSVTEIRSGAFDKCSSLQEVHIPEGVTEIGNFAFYGCKGLTEIHYNGTKSAWKQIKTGIDWNVDTGEYKIYCTDGKIAKTSQKYQNFGGKR